MIVTVNERQHLNNDYECDVCGEVNPTGAVYTQRPYDFPAKHYCFRYCAKCALTIATKIVRMAHPDYAIAKATAKGK